MRGTYKDHTVRQKHELAMFAGELKRACRRIFGEGGQRHFITCTVHFLICTVCGREDPVVEFKVYLISR